MKILYSPNHKNHVPPYEIFNGEKEAHQEIPDRIENIKKSLKTSGYKIDNVKKHVPESLLNKVHNPKYISFFKRTTKKLDRTYRYPSVFPYISLHAENKYEREFVTQGMYSFDLYTPLNSHTYNVAVSSASIAYELAYLLHSKKIKTGYGLCRPPGHHAEKEKMGGYCYLNNAAIAAQYLSSFGKVATLDVDFHHGNGTQDIFYGRNDVLTVSLHADPLWKFPFFTGFADEKGEKKGEGYNFNIPLPSGTTNNHFHFALEKGLKKITDFKPRYLVISLGLDTHKDDPIGGFKLTTDYYEKMSKTIASLRIPAIILQEGGYNTNKLGVNVVSFLSGFS